MPTENKNAPKYRQCYDQIIKYIADNNLSDGDKLPPEDKLVELTKVSRITVRRAIAELEQEKLVKKIQGSGTFVTMANPEAQASQYVPLVLPGYTSDIELLNTILGADKCMSEHSHYLTTHFAHKSAEDERKIIAQLAENGAKCIIIFPCSEWENEQFFSRLEREGVRFVFLDRISEKLSGCLVQCDNLKGGYLAANHLIEQGYRRIAFFSSRPESDAFALSLRRMGYRNALEQHGLPYREEYVSFIPDGGDLHEYFDRLMKLPEPPDAVFCSNDATATEVMYYLEKQGVAVPDEVGVIGFDNSVLLPHLPFELSTVNQPFYDMGYEAAKTACDILDGSLKHNLHKILPVNLIVRKSTARSAPADR